MIIYIYIYYVRNILIVFIGRKKELNELESRYQEGAPQLVVVYGKRRLGKTALLKEFAKDKTHFFYVSRETIDSEQIKLFSEEILSDNPVKEFITTFDSWEKAFLFLVSESKSKKILLIIDEFPYIAQSNKKILSILQKIWDQHNEDNQIMFVLTGSSLAYIEEEILGSDSPLYGRTTSTIKLDILNFEEAKELLKNFSLENQIKYYCILGGIPRYLKILDKNLSFEENIIKHLLNKFSFLYQEVNLLMREELREPSTYYAILSSISFGNHTIKDIAKNTGLDKTKINVYLKNLIQLNVLYKRVPLLLPEEKVNQHRSLYLFNEPYFKFYFYYILSNLSTLEKMDLEDFYKEKVAIDIDLFIEKEFQKIGLEHLKNMNALGELDTKYTMIGNTWNDKVELDIFGFKDDDITLTGKCFFNRLPTIEDINELKQATTLYIDRKKINNNYYFISNLPLTDELKSLEKIDNSINFIELV